MSEWKADEKFINSFRVELITLVRTLLDVVPLSKKMQEDGEIGINSVCDLAIQALRSPQPEAAALTLLDEAIQELGKHYAPKDVIATKEGMDGWNGAVGYCIGTLLRMQDDRRGPQKSGDGH
jgi:hypothetical protein